MLLLLESLINVVTRLAGTPVSWLDELQRYTMIWMAFISGAVLIYEKGHLLVDLVDTIFPHRWRNGMYLIGEIIMLIFLIYLFFPCIEMVTRNMISKSSAMKIPMGYIYLCMPLGIGLSIIAQIDLILKRLFADKEDTEAPLE